MEEHPFWDSDDDRMDTAWDDWDDEDDEDCQAMRFSVDSIRVYEQNWVNQTDRNAMRLPPNNNNAQVLDDDDEAERMDLVNTQHELDEALDDARDELAAMQPILTRQYHQITERIRGPVIGLMVRIIIVKTKSYQLRYMAVCEATVLIRGMYDAADAREKLQALFIVVGVEDPGNHAYAIDLCRHVANTFIHVKFLMERLRDNWDPTSSPGHFETAVHTLEIVLNCMTDYREALSRAKAQQAESEGRLWM